MAKFGNQDLWTIWLKSMQQPMPSEFNQLKDYNTLPYKPPAYLLKPEDIMKFMNAQSVWDLYKKPDSQNWGGFDYPTTAVNYSANPLQDSASFNAYASGKPIDVIMESVKDPVNPFYIIGNMLSLINERKDLTESQKRYIPQGVLEHELAHANDPRLNPYEMWSYPNHGYTTRGRLTGGILQREMPAQKQEEMFMDYIKDRDFQKRLTDALNSNLSSARMPSWKYRQ